MRIYLCYAFMLPCKGRQGKMKQKKKTQVSQSVVVLGSAGQRKLANLSFTVITRPTISQFLSPQYTPKAKSCVVQRYVN